MPSAHCPKTSILAIWKTLIFACARENGDFAAYVRLQSMSVTPAQSRSARKKRSLVVRNLRILEQRFPKHSSECEAFMSPTR